MTQHIDYSFVICPKCGVMPEARTTKCPGCGFQHAVQVEMALDAAEKSAELEVTVPVGTVTEVESDKAVIDVDPVEDPGTAP
jgi:hypothetical protein